MLLLSSVLYYYIVHVKYEYFGLPFLQYVKTSILLDLFFNHRKTHITMYLLRVVSALKNRIVKFNLISDRRDNRYVGFFTRLECIIVYCCLYNI